ncbi:MAG TPA: hypothetical protein VGG32_06900 [Thermoplasmata archaeon]|jgi:hypothetical protein
MSRWRRAGNRGIDDSIWGIAALIIAVIVLVWLSPRLMKRIREGAKEAGGLKADFESGYKSATAANTAPATPAKK